MNVGLIQYNQSQGNMCTYFHKLKVYMGLDKNKT